MPLFGLALAALVPRGFGAPDTDVLRLGFTYATLSNVNENDARASIQALARTIARERRIAADNTPHLFLDSNAAAVALRKGDINALGLTTGEYWQYRNELPVAACLMAVHDTDPTETYLLLVNRRAGLTRLEDLQHHRLGVTGDVRSSLASIWFELALARSGQPPAGQFLERTTRFEKPGKAVLALFFRQIDACLVTQRVFETMTELNPQVGHELVILDRSPPLVPALFVIGGHLTPAFCERLVHEFTWLHSSTAGRQVLTIFQTDRVAERPLSALATSLALLDDYARLFNRPAGEAGQRLATGISP